MKTFSAKPETVKRDWYVVDASGKTLGRLASESLAVYAESISQSTPHTLTRVITSSLLMRVTLLLLALKAKIKCTIAIQNIPVESKALTLIS